jgi:hypothetical protein
MHLAYSALHATDDPKHEPGNPKHATEIQLRYYAYLETCTKYRNHITEVQKYLPGWMPKFR